MANTLRDESSIATTKLLSPSFYENFLVLPRTETRQAWNLAFRSALRHREAFSQERKLWRKRGDDFSPAHKRKGEREISFHCVAAAIRFQSPGRN